MDYARVFQGRSCTLSFFLPLITRFETLRDSIIPYDHRDSGAKAVPNLVTIKITSSFIRHNFTMVVREWVKNEIRWGMAPLGW